MDSQGRPSAHGKLARLLTDREFRNRVIRYSLGLPTPLDTDDRRVLENVIFKHYLASPNVQTILFVGVDWYTKHYEKTYFSDRTLWTLDIEPKARKFGAHRHVVCALEDVGSKFPERFFDLIVCSGVYGFGLNTKPACERAFGACYALLQEGGGLVLGWNDLSEYRPVPLESIEALRRFTPTECPPLGTHRHLTDTPLRHTYQFYEKRTAQGQLRQ